MRDANTMATLVGLAVAWGGPALLVSRAARLLGAPERIATKLLEQVLLWALFGAVAAIVLLWEKQTFASIGLRRLGWPSLAWGLLLAGTMIYIVMPLLTRAIGLAGIPGFEAGLAKVLILPVWFRIIAVVTAGIVEDALFLGYAFTRLTRLTGSYWLAGTVSVIVTSLLHLPNWGTGPVLTYLVAGGLATGFFVWRQDLLANMVAHVTVDAMALIIIPAFAKAP